MPKTKKAMQPKASDAGPIYKGSTLYRALQLVAAAIANKLNGEPEDYDPRSVQAGQQPSDGRSESEQTAQIATDGER